MAYRQRQDSYIRPDSRVKSAPRRQNTTRDVKPKTPAPKRYRKTQPPSGGLFSAKLVIAIFFLFVFVYIGHSIWDFWTPGVDTMIVRMSTVDNPRSETGVIIRDERVHHAERDGTVEFWIPDNERVRVSTLVASVANPYMAQAAGRELAEVEATAMSLRNIRQPFTETESVIQRRNNIIESAVTARIHNFAALNLSEIYSLRDDLNRQINTRNQISIDEGITARDSLARDLERHTAILGAYSRNMYAEASGIMSRVIDGWETELTVASIRDLTPEILQQVTEYEAMVASRTVTEGDALFKIVGNVWYIVAYMPNDMIYDFVENTNRTVYLLNENTGSYEPHSLRIQSIQHGTRYSMVVFRNTRHVIEFMNQRSVSIRTSSGIQRGLKIPDTAITTRTHFRIPVGFIHGEISRYILISTETGNIMVHITVDEATAYYAYIPATYSLAIDSLLVPNDPYGSHMLLTHEHVRERHMVYLVRLGAAEPREIHLGEGGISAGYILLDPALNPGISEFAHIVTDATTVVAGQLIR